VLSSRAVPSCADPILLLLLSESSFAFNCASPLSICGARPRPRRHLFHSLAANERHLFGGDRSSSAILQSRRTDKRLAAATIHEPTINTVSSATGGCNLLSFAAGSTNRHSLDLRNTLLF